MRRFQCIYRNINIIQFKENKLLLPLIPGQIGNLREGRFVLAYGSKDTVDHGGEGMAEEIWGGWAHCIHRQETDTGRKVSLAYKTFFFPYDPLLPRRHLLKVPQPPQTAPDGVDLQGMTLCSIAVRYNEFSDLEKKSIWLRACLRFQRVRVWSSWGEAWWQAWCWRKSWELTFDPQMVGRDRKQDWI